MYVAIFLKLLDIREQNNTWEMSPLTALVYCLEKVSRLQHKEGRQTWALQKAKAAEVLRTKCQKAGLAEGELSRPAEGLPWALINACVRELPQLHVKNQPKAWEQYPLVVGLPNSWNENFIIHGALVRLQEFSRLDFSSREKLTLD